MNSLNTSFGFQTSAGELHIHDPDQTSARAPGAELRFPAGALVLVAGLPGAGKSTLLERLYELRGDETQPVAAGTVRVIDSRQARNWWARYLAPIPPRVRIPLIYTTHVWRIARALVHGHAVVAHTRGTWPHLLYGFAWLAHRLGTDLHVVLLDVPPLLAREGQLSRGRVLTAPTFARHVRRWRRMVNRVLRTGALPPARTVTVLDRPAADQVNKIRFDA